MSMNPQVKAKWLTRLRDPETKQTTQHLKDEDGFCCLGVLCEIAVEEGVIPPSTAGTYMDEPSRGGHKIIYGHQDEDGRNDYSSTSLPNVVRDWAGLSSDNPEVVHKITVDDDANYDFESDSWTPVEPYDQEVTDTLAEINDNGKSFREIADLIEAQL